ncbi:hypothetical protein NERG_01913 [Nematocida ausubeli]|uniref:RNA helicase n=1 Tax=Nematocida ausubeli (strain ATCC PRA-371 / ERTm2) TaxID=1913371 RepID=H8ZE92_NEMA1|nr:hypothetical protein NERG_01913 [Nematocida ausubeli]
MKIFSVFEELGLADEILKGAFAYGFSQPSKIQQDAIKIIASGANIILQSRNGTGKTAAFIIGMLQKIINQSKNTNQSSCGSHNIGALCGKGVVEAKPGQTHSIEAIILSPTRDLALQTFGVFQGLAQFTSIKGYCAVGQEGSIAEDIKEVRKCNILFGTAGRVLHLIRELKQAFSTVHGIVVDEADRIVESGFSLPVQGICERLKAAKPQFVFVSATLPDEVQPFFQEYAPDAKAILVPQQELALERISQYYIPAGKDRFNRMCDVFGAVSISQAVVFANKKETVEEVGRNLQRHEFPAVVVHGALPQTERNKRLSDFFSGKSRILVSTDVCARGIDAVHVNLVVNYDAPHTAEEYLHRIGRGGRFGKTSTAITFVNPGESTRAQGLYSAFGRTLKEWK